MHSGAPERKFAKRIGKIETHHSASTSGFPCALKDGNAWLHLLMLVKKTKARQSSHHNKTIFVRKARDRQRPGEESTAPCWSGCAMTPISKCIVIIEHIQII